MKMIFKNTISCLLRRSNKCGFYRASAILIQRDIHSVDRPYSTNNNQLKVEYKHAGPEELYLKFEESKTTTRAQKLKKAVAEYGSTVIIFHIAISLVSLGTCYLLVSTGLDIGQVFTFLGLNNWVSKSSIAANAGTFAVAYAVHKVFAPLRISITLGSVPFIVRYLKNRGILQR